MELGAVLLGEFEERREIGDKVLWVGESSQ